MPAENKMTMTRVIFGVASVGATLALMYLYNKYQEKKDKSGNSASSSGSRVRRQSSKSGEVKKVTFKESDDESQKDRDRIRISGDGEAAVTATTSTSNDSKLRKELNNKENLSRPPQPVATHDATKNPFVGVVEGPPQPSRQGPSGGVGGRTSCSLDSTTPDEINESSGNTTNKYENNSTLKLEDSTITTNNRTTVSSTSSSAVVKAPVVEEVITRSKDGPLMTSTPLPAKDPSGHVPLRVAAAVFEPHSSDLQSSAAQAQAVDGKSLSQTSAVMAESLDYDALSFRKEMRIPREIVAGLIGKKGCNIKNIQAQSGTTINFHDQSKFGRSNICFFFVS